MDENFAAVGKNGAFCLLRRPGQSPAVGRTVSRVAMFLQRDLSEEAIQKPAEPRFNPLELAATRQEGFAAGRLAGLAEATASQAAARATAEARTLEIISVAITDGCATAGQVADVAADALARTLVASLQAIMPDLIRRTGLNELRAMLAHVLPGLSREPAIAIEVPNEIAEYVSATVASVAAEQRGKISVVGLENMASGTVRIRWGAGHAQRQPGQIWQAITRVLDAELSEPVLKDTPNGE